MSESSGTASVGPPAARPCDVCPYRRDVPSGVWAESEYDKLRDYDRPTHEQPLAVFQCHLNDRDAERARLCAGWVGCHDAENLLSLRVAVASAFISPSAYDAALDYVSPVPLFASAAEAATHGIAEIERPSAAATRAITKIVRIRSDLQG